MRRNGWTRSPAADDAGRYLAGAAIVKVWQLDYDAATEVRQILHI
jgi:hypothetical protein